MRRSILTVVLCLGVLVAISVGHAEAADKKAKEGQIDAEGYPAFRSDFEAASRWDQQGYSGAIFGWTPTGDTPKYYRIGSDAAVSHNGKRSAFIESKGPQPPRAGYLLQTISADNYAGKRVRLSAFSLAEHVDRAELFLRIEGVCGSFARTVQTITGRGRWDQYSVVLDVPNLAILLSYGIGITGPGSVRLDDVKLEIVDLAIPVTTTSVDYSRLAAGPVNLGLTEVGSTGTPKGWRANGNVAVNDTAACGRSPCVSVSSRGADALSGSGGMMQSIRAEKYLGRQLRLTAALKTENVAGGAQLYMRIDSISGRMTAFDNMSNHAIQGTKDWSKYEVVLPVAPDSAVVNFGFFLAGSGKAFMKDVRIEVVPNSLPSTNVLTPASCVATSVVERERDRLRYPTQPVNLDFEK